MRTQEFEVEQFRPQVSERRFRSLIPIDAGRQKAVATRADRFIDQRLS